MGKLPGITPASMKSGDWLAAVAVFRRPWVPGTPPPPEPPRSEFDAWPREQRDKERKAPG